MTGTLHSVPPALRNLWERPPVAAATVAVAQPGTTAPIPGPGSVAELATVRIGGHDQTVMLRGSSDRAPILLCLAGGPGGTDSARCACSVSSWRATSWSPPGTSAGPAPPTAPSTRPRR